MDGKKGTIKKYVKDDGRWAVKVDDVKELKTIQPQELETPRYRRSYYHSN
jgi:hypothetical protein